MITAIVGRPGCGKSVWLVGRVFDFLCRRRHVYTNVDIKLPKRYIHLLQYYHPIQSLDDCVMLREGEIVLDELQVYLNSRNWDKLDTRFQLLLQQHRKRGLNITGATQSIKRADTVFRELIHSFYTINKLVSVRVLGMSFGAFYLCEYDPDSVEGALKRSWEMLGWPSLYIVDPVVFSLYDTTEEYALETPEGEMVEKTYVMVKKEKVEYIPTLIKEVKSRQQATI